MARTLHVLNRAIFSVTELVGKLMKLNSAVKNYINPAMCASTLLRGLQTRLTKCKQILKMS